MRLLLLLLLLLLFLHATLPRRIAGSPICMKQ
jgi:hypothetical protein